MIISGRLRRELSTDKDFVILINPILSFLLPDVVVMGWRFDLMMSFVFAIIPVICELTSIIEKLNLLDADLVKIYGEFSKFVKSIRKE